jgi:protocatechuate 3,4-dioxygenase beta subunit
MTTSTRSYSPVSVDGLTINSINVAETDVGSVTPFTATANFLFGVSTQQTTGTFSGLNWVAFDSGIAGAGSSESLTITFSVTAAPGQVLTAMNALYTVDQFGGPGDSVTATEAAYDTSGNLLGAQSYTYGQPPGSAIALSGNQQTINVTLTLTESIDANLGNAQSAIDMSGLQLAFQQAAPPPPATASIGDIVFLDMTGSGQEPGFDSGPGVAGVTVELLNGTGTSVLATTTTDSNGMYAFSNLQAGVYEVAFVAPTGYSFSPQGVGGSAAASINSSPNQTTGITGPITLTTGEADHNVEAGLVSGGSASQGTATIGDYVWFDANHNGVQDSTETGVAGVTVDLLDSTGTSTIAVTTTDSTGHYSFTNLNAGTYEVQFVAPTADAFTTPGAGTDVSLDSNANSTGITAPVTLTAGQIDTTIDAGLTGTASIGDYVWFDSNLNGVQDSGETGVAGVTVDLLNAAGTSTLAVTTTDSTGHYSFTNLAAGSYEVQFVAPTGDAFSTPQQGGNSATDSNPNATTGITAPVTLTAGQTDTTIDAGVHGTAALGDYVWFDSNLNGVQDSTETGVAGVTVDLLNAAGTSTLAVTTTDSTGHYSFTNLAAGSYEVQFVSPTGDAFSTPLQGGNTATDSNPNATTGITAPVTLAAGQTDTTIDAGVHGTAALGDYVWFDSNLNGIQDSTETGVAGVTVDLLNAAGTSTLAVTTTDSTGHYSFTNLAAGSYEVQFVAPTGDAFSTPLQGGNTATDSNPNSTTGITAPVTLAAGQTDTTIDAGVHGTAALGDYVWFDSNLNGVQDSTETGVAGVTVDLLNAAGTSTLAVTTTDSTGHYSFANLAAGSYEVQFVAPTGDAFSTPLQGGNTATDSNPNATTGVTAPVTLTAGQTDTTIDAGVHGTAALGDYVWFDSNLNGIQDSTESGVAGVTVDLLNAAGTSTLAVTTTDSTGHYSFTNLAAGSYDVKFVAPTGDAFSAATQGTNPAVDSNANVSTGITAPVTLTAGQTDTTIDAGVHGTAALGDYVWFDANNNGIQDSTETGVAGVTVDLLNAAGTSTLAVTTTDSTGHYSFTNLAAGSYDVKFVAPTGDAFTAATQGSNAALDSNANVSTGLTAPVTLASGQTDTSIDAGLISNQVDLSVTKTDGVTSIAAGSQDTYTITVTNNGPATVSSFSMLDNVPANLVNPVFGTPSAGSYSATTDVWSGLNLASGQSVSITLTGTIAAPAGGTTTTTYTASGSSCDGAESGSATVVTGTNQIIVTLWSNQANPTSAGQEVSGISFSLGSTPVSATLSSSSGSLIDIASGGSVTAYSGGITHWGVAECGSTLTLATAGTGAVGGCPIDLIIGSGPYTNANPSITGRDPQIQGPATFVLTVPGVTASTKISNVAIEFGTGPDSVLACSSSTTTTGGGSGSITNTVTVTPLNGQIDTNTANNTASDTDTITPAVPATAAIGDYVWWDINANGLQDSTETGIAGVTVDLLNAAGTSTLAVTTTDSTGHYGFGNLVAGTYEVKFIAPAGDVFTAATQGGNTAIDSNPNVSTGITAPVTLTAGQTNTTIDAGLKGTGAIGNFVWLDVNHNGLQDSAETGVAGVTVDLLNAAGTSVLAVTTTDSSGNYMFSNLLAGTYEVKFLAPAGDGFSPQGQGTNGAIDSNPNVSTGITAPITLAAGQTNTTIDAGLVKTAGLSVLKLPAQVVVNACGQVSYTFKVTNTGSAGLTNVNIQDNIGTAAKPDLVTPTAVLSNCYNVGDTNHNGVLDPGETWQYAETVNQIACNTGSSSVYHTASGSNLDSGCTAWFSSSFNPTSCKDGATYVFQGVSCTISGKGVGGSITQNCPDAVVTFSKNCTQASTTYDSNRDCWVTTLPANCNPGSVFVSGLPVSVPSGCSLNDCSFTWSIGQSSNNCGQTNLSWDASCTGFQSFSQNGCNGQTDYNQIGVKVCDNNGGYGNGGSCDSGYGWNGSGYCDTGSSYGGYGGYGSYGWGGNGYGGYNGCGWVGSSSDCAGTPENQYTQNNCDTGGYSQSWGGYGGYGYSGYGCGSYGGYYYGCGGSGYGSGSCGGSGSAGNGGTTSITGAADTVTVTASTASGIIVTASDTKLVQVLGTSSNISVNCSAPVGSLVSLYGTAQTLEFTYNPCNTVTTHTAGIGSVSGSNSASMAFVEISNNANPLAANATVYFQGSVASGEKIYADATTNVFNNTAVAGGHFDTTAGADIYAFVYKSQADFKAGAAPVQTMAYNTSGSQAMYANDDVGSLKLVGFVGAKGGYLAS